MKTRKYKFGILGGVVVVCAGYLPVANAALSLPNPIEVSAGPVGKIGVQGVVSGMAFWQDNPQGDPGTLGAKHVGADITNGMAIVQKSSGLLQFYLQAGAYSGALKNEVQHRWSNGIGGDEWARGTVS